MTRGPYHRPVEDRALVDAVLDGDHQAFERLVERETAAIFRVCYRVLGRVLDAEDAAQETFVIAYRALGTYRGEGSLGAWLARIAVRQSLRLASRRQDTAPLDTVGAAAPRASSDPAAEAVEAERARAIRLAVEGLPDPYREVVVLRYFAEFDSKEIAKILDMPDSTVRSHLRTGRQRLALELKKAGYQHE